MNRRAFAAVLFGIGAMLPTAAPGQNLEAGKSPGQIFSNTCSTCHRSPRGLLRTVPPGSLPGFLREHYTTSKDMAQQLAGFLIANGATDTRGRPQEARQQPPGAEPPRPPRPGEPEQVRPRSGEQEQPRPQRPVEPEPAARPQDVPAAQAVPSDPNAARLLRREERRAKREADRKREAQEAAAVAARTPAAEREKNRRSRVTPAKIEAASERGKFALPLGDVVKVESPPASAPDPEKPSGGISPQPEAATRADPVPQVTPAPPTPSAAEMQKDTASPESSRADDPPSGSTTPTPPEPPHTPPPVAEKPPAPPISN